ncbi:TetR/AcrR family transcriptional regulator [Antrihabitans cavernicola]|uniref:TetR/AcrR family transcriptional regulator n=1 Tax=Antrihabitans cavernicola TaxID=2495913 RepID=UPI001658C414|nr:TetR/AcrR family transcriptional regulator [Spelaeibacter cavernicola]
MRTSEDVSPADAERIDRRRNEIIGAAARLFSEKGYHETGIADIAAFLGIGHGTFYRYFKNKMDIASSAFDRVVALLGSTMLGEDPESSNTIAEYREQVGRIVYRLFELLDTEPALVRLFHRNSLDIDRLSGAMDEFTRYTERFIVNGVRKGFLRADLNTELAAQLLMAVLFDVTRRAAQQTPSAELRERLLTDGLDIIFLGLGERPERR